MSPRGPFKNMKLYWESMCFQPSEPQHKTSQRPDCLKMRQIVQHIQGTNAIAQGERQKRLRWPQDGPGEPKMDSGDRSFEG